MSSVIVPASGWLESWELEVVRFVAGSSASSLFARAGLKGL